jgi:hypothetical protein
MNQVQDWISSFDLASSLAKFFTPPHYLHLPMHAYVQEG